MRKPTAVAGSALFFIVAPGVVAGVVPWWLTDGWQVRAAAVHWPVLRTIGVGLLLAGLAVLIPAFARFVTEGRGTPAPVAAPARLVVGGVYRYVRNPMYLAVVAVIVGQALLLGQFGLLPYAAVVGLLFAVFVRWYEEPALQRQFGPQYDEYRGAVPGWLPRLRPSTPGGRHGADQRSCDGRAC